MLLSKRKVKDQTPEAIQYRGVDIQIENGIGSIRNGIDAGGQAWQTKFFYPYGFIIGVKGIDGEELDCFVGNDEPSPNVYVINQIKHDGHYIDEQKVMFGFNSAIRARDAYLAHFNTQGYLGTVDEIPFDKYKQQLDLILNK